MLLGLAVLLLVIGQPNAAAEPNVQTLRLVGRSNVEAYNVTLAQSDRQWLKQHGPLPVGLRKCHVVRVNIGAPHQAQELHIWLSGCIGLPKDQK